MEQIKNHATSQGEKIIQPLGIKKSCNLMGQKKSRNLLGQKKNMQPLGSKDNHATSRDKKIRQPLRKKQRSRNLSGLKKIRQPLGENITQPLRTKKKCNLFGTKKNQATLWDIKKSCNLPGPKKSSNLLDKKITLSIDRIASKLVLKAPNCSKWH